MGNVNIFIKILISILIQQKLYSLHYFIHVSYISRHHTETRRFWNYIIKDKKRTNILFHIRKCSIFSFHQVNGFAIILSCQRSFQLCAACRDRYIRYEQKMSSSPMKFLHCFPFCNLQENKNQVDFSSIRIYNTVSLSLSPSSPYLVWIPILYLLAFYANENWNSNSN